ncbi:MAG: hypothetical protein NC302_01170 [Bacteroidales bacterium]|nr:hypothetical protein [Bacteroidales bacterium]MCM1414493.1 hypothetical protein [bacterium]MCM1423755.1 hypothetical protein [bacterium]
MKKRKTFLVFLVKCIAIPAAALLLLWGLNRSYRQYDDEKYRDMWGLRMLGNQVNNVKIANVGSSHGAYDFSYDAFTEQGITCFNFGHTSQTYDYDLALLAEYGQHLEAGGVLFIPVSYFSFNNETANATEAQALSVKYYHFLSPENVPGYDLFTDVVTHRLPILSAGEDLLKLLPGQPFSLTVLAAEEPDAPGMDEAAVAAFANQAAQRFERHFNNKEEYFLPEREEQLYAIIDYCKKHGITPVLITTPFSGYYNAPVPEDFLDRFYGTVNRIASDTNVSYYDYSHDARFTESLPLFSDPDHLTDEGAAYFTAILAEEMPELRAVLYK